jgi:hypothetical protein
MSEREPRLIYQDTAWRGENDVQHVVVTEEALLREADDYKAQHGGTLAQALRTVKRVAYWDASMAAKDVRVAARRPQRPPPRERPPLTTTLFGEPLRLPPPRGRDGQ